MVRISKTCFQLILLTTYPLKLIKMDQFLLPDLILASLPSRIYCIFLEDAQISITMIFIALMLKVKLGKLKKPKTKRVYLIEHLIQL